MRPSTMLVDHPCLVLPVLSSTGIELEPTTRAPAARLRREDRVRLAAQLFAVSALMAEFDLWPGRAALRNARWVYTEHGVLAQVSGMPRRLSAIHGRLGGGEGAADLTREAVVQSVSDAVGLPGSWLREGTTEPGLALAPVLHRVLGELSRPLDPATASCLWAVRWDLPPLPEAGEVRYWSVPHQRLATRLAAAIWCALRLRGRSVWFYSIGEPDSDTAPVSAVSAEGTVVVAGDIGEEDLAAVERWVDRGGRSAVVVGDFPHGWKPSTAPGFDPDRLYDHLAVVGPEVDRCRMEVERRRGRFHPLNPPDTAALTASARWVFDDQRAQECEAEPADRGVSTVARLLGLRPEGLPEAFLALHSGVPPPVFKRAAAELQIVVRDGCWRLAQTPRLTRDPLHEEVAALYPADDPRRFRHLALAGDDAGELAVWVEERLMALDHGVVRDVLAPVSPGELGTAIQCGLVEACLGELDLAGARDALEDLPRDVAAPFERWLDAADAAPDWRPQLVDEDHVSRWPRASAEVAVRVLARAMKHGQGDACSAAAMLDRCVESLRGASRSWCEVERAAVARPELLGDRQWRRVHARPHPMVWRRLLHHRAMQLDARGRSAAARRILERAASQESSPGWLGLFQLDLGAIAILDGRAGHADTHLLKAHRLLKVAGFHNRTRYVLFNLGVTDLDRLQVDRASHRLHEGADGPTDPHFLSEWARLALAIGDETEFENRLRRLPKLEAGQDPNLVEGFSFLRGVEALLGNQHREARRRLSRGGLEGKVWLDLQAAVHGKDGPNTGIAADGWGVSRAARLARVAAVEGAKAALESLPSVHGMSPADALSVALLERIGGVHSWLPQPIRRAAARVLQAQGLTGWASHLRSDAGCGPAVLTALAQMVEAGGPTALDAAGSEQLLAALELAGLEIRSHPAGEVVWRTGSGSPGAAIRRGSVLVAPLGGELNPGPAWRLVGAIIELLTPAKVEAEEPGAAESGFYGCSEAAGRVRVQLRQLAGTRLAIAVLGETGVGKDVAARALHVLSGRRGEFVPVNIAAIPGTLLEAELFGSVKGAFTGADQARRGLVAAADRGTLFLDEIGDLDLPLQVKLLRFLETREVRPVGSDRVSTVDVRIVCATHEDLEQLVSAGRFRRDLFYRIANASVVIPPLRERRADIELLRDLFVREAVARDELRPARWSRSAEAMLLRYHWPGNARQLRHIVIGALVRADGGVINAADLQLPGEGQASTGTWEEETATFRRRLLESALRRNGDNRTAAARQLGISRQTLLYHMRKLGVGRD